MSQAQGNITRLLRAAATGDPQDAESLMIAIYDDLKRMAASQLKHERVGHTLNPTSLVHEAYLRLINQHSVEWNDRVHFFSIASRIIRRILTDHARKRGALKRGGANTPIRIAYEDVPAPSRDLDLVALDEALGELSLLSERQAQIVELRFFGGMTNQEIAQALSMGLRSVDREWQVARLWLFHRLSELKTESSDAPGH